MVIKVYGLAMSTCTQKVLTTLIEKGLKYEIVNIDFAAGEHKSPKYLEEKQPFGVIPVLVDEDGFKIYEPSITVNLLEQVYLLRDPFVAIKNKDDQTKISSVIIGSTCSVCSSPVCVHLDCSLFYTRRFCLKCIAKYRDEFPREVLDEIGVKRLDKFTNEEYEQYDEN
ncbi:unnamed protein product [Adineta steineri]|uniref:Cysteine-rich DPF motif domain-containing protein 1 n=1 Tax=Adineta steineri TaxID=433720 RepID=A0A814BFL9_9BILA|nr:unnamed protein product [Adineta steineri]CAF0928623.1 unnamed protein product [Adineta steineri]